MGTHHHGTLKHLARGGLALLVLTAACGQETTPTEGTAAEEPTAHGAPDAVPTETTTDAGAARPIHEAPDKKAYTLRTLVPGGPFHGIHGLTFDRDGRLLVGSVVGQSIYEVDTETGDSTTLVGPPQGMADDIEQGPDGTLVWTGFSDGKVYAQAPGGEIITIAEGLPGANSLAFAPDGRLFFTQVFLGDALYEADPTGANPPRKIMEGMGGLNGFDFGPDGKLYGPLWFKEQIVRVDVDSGSLETVATGFAIPAAVNFNSKGELFAVDTARGTVVRVDTDTGETETVATVAKAIDNLAFDAQDRLFLTVMAENAVYEVNVEDGSARKVISSPLATAGDVTLITRNGVETLYVADIFALRAVDVATGEIREVGRVFDPEALVDYPISIGSDASGQIALASFASSSLQTLDTGAQTLGTVHHGFVAVTDAVPHGDAILFLDIVAGALKRAGGEDLATVEVIAEGLVGPASVIHGPEGSVYISEYAGLISRIDLETGERTVVAEGLQGPEGMALTPEGRLVVAEAGARRISSVDPVSGEIMILAEDLPIGLPGAENAPPMNLPTGVAVTSSGDILFSSDLNVGIYVLTRGSEL